MDYSKYVQIDGSMELTAVLEQPMTLIQNNI